MALFTKGDESMAQTLDLSTDDKNYSEDQRRLLAQAFRDLGYEVNE